MKIKKLTPEQYARTRQRGGKAAAAARTGIKTAGQEPGLRSKSNMEAQK